MKRAENELDSFKKNATKFYCCICGNIKSIRQPELMTDKFSEIEI